MFIFFIVAFSLTAKPQATGNYQLTVFGTRNGLLSPKIYSLLQASDHQLWIGTEIGASRYNGYTFQNLQYTTANEQVGKVVAITEDSAGGMWMGGEGGLFYFFNGELIRCVFVENYVAAVESLTTDKNGAVWIGEMHGLYRLTRDEINKWRTNKKTLQLKPFGNIQQRIICLDADSGGNIYFGSFDGVFQLSGGNPTATRLWKNTDPSNLVRFITALSPDSLFFNQYNGESTSIIQGAISRYTAKDNVGHNFFRTGPSIYRLTTSTVERFQNGAFTPFINFGLQTNFAFDALCDAEGNIWVGTWEGLFKYRYNPFTIYQRKGTQHPETFSMLETGDGRVMFGGNRGTVHIKKGNEIVPLNEIKPPFGLAEVLAIYQHTDGSFWFGSGYQGITRLRNNSYTSFNESNGLPDNHCNTFFKVGEHTVFGCTEKGVIVLDPLAEQPVKGHYQFSKAYNRQPKLLGVFQPQPDRFLFYSNQGLFRLKDGMLYAEMIDGLPAQNLYITGIQQDKSGQIWIATQGKGLLQCRYGKNGLRLENQFTKRDGLLSDELLSVLVD
ncbi:MAG TPA: two-component regulator propeller domain-containing protein, partial [Flavisolibacter sp.]|nr:two-component regulator propeller domain-containing protein [Flavisolibacter sp.]